MALNYIWVSFFLLAFIVALGKLMFLGDQAVFSELVKATMDMSKTAFEISIGLTGILALWLGIMKIAENSGVIKVLAFLLGPFFKRIFPEIPSDHPAMVPIMMNFAANMLGLDNAATPLGLKAMQEMQKLNPRKHRATNAQIMFLVLNTSGLTIIPITIIMYRAEMGAANPADIFLPILLATICSTLAGLIITASYQRINLLQPVVLAYLLGLVGIAGGTVYFFSTLPQAEITRISTLVSNLVLFTVIVGIITMAVLRRTNPYEHFIEGAKEGFQIAITIVPYLVAILVGVGVFRASGAMDLAVSGVSALFHAVGMRSDFIEALPTALMKPLSGSGARGMMIEAMKTHGADSLVGRMACVFQGATDTTLYILALYFGSVGIKQTRHALGCGLFADLFGIIAAVIFTLLFFQVA
jgi:spore maturation protein SpmA